MDRNKAENIAKIIADTFRGMASTETVIGEQFQVGELTFIPLIKICVGFGAGGGERNNTDSKKPGADSGGMGGGGLSVEPIGFLIISGNEVQLLNVGRKGVIEAILDSVPELAAKAAEIMKEKEKK